MKRVLFLIITIISMIEARAEDNAAPTPTDRKNALAIEIVGRSLGLSITYDREFWDFLSFGVGLGYCPMFSRVVAHGGSSGGFDGLSVPVYANFRVWGDEHRLVASIGSNLTYNNKVQLYTSLGIGGEFRPASGFLFRFNVYVISPEGGTYFASARGPLPWFGISFGHTY